MISPMINIKIFVKNLWMILATVLHKKPRYKITIHANMLGKYILSNYQLFSTHKQDPKILTSVVC